MVKATGTESGHTLIFANQAAVKRYLMSSEREELHNVQEFDARSERKMVEYIRDQGQFYR